MPTTANYALPYPGLTNAPNVPADIQALAVALDTNMVGATMGAPTALIGAGTPSVGTTETRDALLGSYTFTALAGRRYQVVMSGLHSNGSVVGDYFYFNIRNGGASTPTAASALIASSQAGTLVAATAGRMAVPLSGTFNPGAGVQTLSMFTVRVGGTGVCTPISANSARELYCVDLGKA